MANLHSIEQTPSPVPTASLNLALGFGVQLPTNTDPTELREAASDLIRVASLVLYSPSPDEGLALEPADRAALWATLSSASDLLAAADSLSHERANRE